VITTTTTTTTTNNNNIKGVNEELYFFACDKSVESELSNVVKFLLEQQISKVQGKQLTLRGRVLTGKWKLSNTQVFSLYI
jgi:hypothetical protein